MIGSSYEGFTVVMALLHPHPALKVAAPESPMVDGWMGDDWFHYGAFRQANFDYCLGADRQARRGRSASRATAATITTNFLATPARPATSREPHGLDQLPYWQHDRAAPRLRRLLAEPGARQADRAAARSTVPTMWEQGLWDQEDMWGAIHSYEALKPKDKDNDMNYLVMGPWCHSQVNREGRNAGPVRVGRRHRRAIPQGRAAAVLQPVSEGRRAQGRYAAACYIYNTGEDHWDRFELLAAELREGLPAPIEAALSRGERRPLVRRHRRRVRQVR